MVEDQKRCGCGGEIKQGAGCLTYNGSDDHQSDAQHEDFMRHYGRGFGSCAYPDSFDAMMSMHLQANGLTFDEANELMRKPQPAETPN